MILIGNWKKCRIFSKKCKYLFVFYLISRHWVTQIVGSLLHGRQESVSLPQPILLVVSWQRNYPGSSAVNASFMSICQTARNHTDGLVQERPNSIALAMVLRLSCTNPSIHPNMSQTAWICAESLGTMHLVTYLKLVENGSYYYFECQLTIRFREIYHSRKNCVYLC